MARTSLLGSARSRRKDKTESFAAAHGLTSNKSERFKFIEDIPGFAIKQIKTAYVGLIDIPMVALPFFFNTQNK